MPGRSDALLVALDGRHAGDGPTAMATAIEAAAQRKGESPRRFRGDRWGKGKEEYAPGSLIVSIWYRTNRRGEYNALATLCKGLGTRNLKFFALYTPES